MNIKECLEKGLLRKENIDLEKAKKSMQIAEYKLERAKKLFELDIYDESVVNSYASMFHTCRVLLFKEGFTEKSHYALFIFIKDKYKDKIEKKFINEFNNLRLERHEITYGLDKFIVNKEETKQVLEIAEEFLKAIIKLV